MKGRQEGQKFMGAYDQILRWKLCGQNRIEAGGVTVLTVLTLEGQACEGVRNFPVASNSTVAVTPPRVDLDRQIKHFKTIDTVSIEDSETSRSSHFTVICW